MAIYPSLASLALQRKCWSPSEADLPPTSTGEFLALAMACTGLHGRAAALVCETTGVHRGLRSLDGGLAVLGRWLTVGGSMSSDGDDGRGHRWFRTWMDRLRDRALVVYEEDVLM